MIEHFTKAVILGKEDVRDYDTRVFLYCEGLGKIVAKATSLRKITSKLAAHMEPGNIVEVRLINKNSFQLADAVKINSLPKNPKTIRMLEIVKELSAEGQFDPDLWNYFFSGELTSEKALEALGYGLGFASCQNCGAKNPTRFLVNELAYHCEPCFVQIGRPVSFVIE